MESLKILKLTVTHLKEAKCGKLKFVRSLGRWATN